MHKIIPCILSLFIYPTILFATYTAPIIDTITPNTFVQVNPSLGNKATETIVISGIRLWPKPDPRFGGQGQRVTVLFGNYNGGYQQMYDFTTGTDGQEQTVTVHFPVQPWLTKAGQLQVIVKVEERASPAGIINVIPAVQTSPTLNSVTPDQFKVLSELNTSTTSPWQYYRITVAGADFGSPSDMTCSIGGFDTNMENIDIASGTFEATIPQNLWNTPGSYPITVNDSYGASNSVMVNIIQKQQAPAVDTNQNDTNGE